MIFAIRSPFWKSDTFQRTPFRFWSTSNSTSMRPSSPFSFNLDVLEPVHVPRTRIWDALLRDGRGGREPTVSAASAAAIPTFMLLIVSSLRTYDSLPRPLLGKQVPYRNGTLVVSP